MYHNVTCLWAMNYDNIDTFKGKKTKYLYELLIFYNILQK